MQHFNNRSQQLLVLNLLAALAASSSSFSLAWALLQASIDPKAGRASAIALGLHGSARLPRPDVALFEPPGPSLELVGCSVACSRVPIDVLDLLRER